MVTKFFKKLFFFLLTLLSFLVLFKIVVGDDYSNDVILDYQKEKIKSHKNLDTAFFGDSSCGNAIDAKLYGYKSLNLSLVGDYIVCGSLEMVKMTKKRHPTLKKVILMHTLDGFNRDKYIFKQINQEKAFFDILIDDLFVFSTKIITLNISSLFINTNSIDNNFDYLSQKKKTDVIIPKVLKSSISEINKKCILDLKEYSKKNKIDYLFLIGPSTKIKKNKFYYQLMTFFKQNEINFVEQNFLLNEKNIGDGNDHVANDYKHESTLFYKNIIEKFFKTKK